MRKDEEKGTKIRFPDNLIKPIKDFLEGEVVKMKKTKKKLEESDPFEDESRGSSNSIEEDLDEQLGHFDTQVKVKFISKQIVQLRKALTRIKIGKYGICEKCGKMINTDRLAVKPESTICISCEKENES